MTYLLRTEKTWAATLDELEETFRKWGVADWAVYPRRLDSRKSWWGTEERRVTVVFSRNGQEQRFSLDAQERPVDNLRALYLGLEAIRLNEMRGIGDVVREMYLQLPAPARTRDAYEVLGVRPDVSLEDAEAMYRIRAQRLHPDKGGDVAAMVELNEAIERVREERGR